MSAAWPLPPNSVYWLPDVDVDPGDGKERSEVDEGAPQQRPTASAAVGRVRGTIVLTRSQLQTFRDWGRVTLGQWSLSFDWLEPEGDGPAVFQFADRPTWRPIRAVAGQADRIWAVSLDLERLS